MRDKRNAGVPVEFDDPAEERLWRRLGDLPEANPSAALRDRFYSELETASTPALTRLERWLGFDRRTGWITAVATLLVGVGVGQTFGTPARTDESAFAALETQVALLNKNLILDRLESTSPTKRLRGIIDAVHVVESDDQIAKALLQRAIDDNVLSVRSAAIDALGPQVKSPAVGDELMALLESAHSPLVQLALVDLVLRHGSGEQRRQLLRLAEQGRLHTDLIDHVLSSIVRSRV
ncbi:MAG: hypothetical protein AAF417_06485 [Pseudomonadota bacterium]